MDPLKSPVTETEGTAVPHSTIPSAEWTPTPNRGIDDESRTSSCLQEMLDELSTPKTPVPQTSTASQKFDLALLDLHEINSPTPVLLDSKYFDERDFQSHRREDFPQTHQPLRPILTRPLKKKLSVIPSHPSEEGDQMEECQQPLLPNQPHSTPITLKLSSLSSSPEVSLNSPPLDFQDMMDFNSKKVQFEVGGTPFQMDQPPSAASDLKKYKVPVVEDPQHRLQPGDVRNIETPLLHSAIDLGELPQVDKDEDSSRRFDNSKGFRRHKYASKGQISEEDSVPHRLNKYDHKPHEIFVELDILTGCGAKREWKESARWIKYEEDLEEGADRWGKPHVASLSFHSLINLRRLLETGVVLLDLEERDLPGVAYRVVEQMGTSELILMEEKALVLRSLLLKHRHVNESGKVWNIALKRSPESHSSLQTVFEDRSQRKGLTTVQSVDPGMLQTQNQLNRRVSASGLTHQTSLPAQMWGGNLNGRDDVGIRRRSSGGCTNSHLELNMNKITPGLSEEDLKWIEKESTLMRQIPSDSEATIVLVGNDDSLHGVTIAFVRLAESVYMPNITEVPIPVRFLFILMGPSSADLDYKEIGRSIATLMSNQQFHSLAYQAEDRRDLLKGINDFLDVCIVLPHGDWDDDLIPFHDLREKNKATQRRKLQQSVRGEFPHIPRRTSRPTGAVRDGQNPFKRTRKLFGGLCNDVRRRYPIYFSDIRDGVNFQCVATIIFLYFACISGAIAFGDLLKVKTDDYIGIPESLVGSAIGGIMFSLLAGQPLIIVGSTGPSLVFDESLFKFCKSSDMKGSEILAVRSWIGFWIAIIGLLVACFEGSVLVRFFTRFTQEVFAVLISFVFIYESFLSLLKIYREHPLLDDYTSNSTQRDTAGEKVDPRPNVALLSTILMLGTFYIANLFRQCKNGAYFTKAIRKTLGNFGVLIAIVVMSSMDALILHPDTKKLSIPDVSAGLKNTDPTKRDWFTHPLDLPLNWIYAAIIPAFLLYILIFLESSIAGLIVGKRELKLKKGSAFHLDVLILCLINAVMGICGLPWISSAIVRAVAHVVALSVYSTNNPPGEKPVLIGVKEQRVTSFVVSILLGCSVLMGPLLRLIPMAVLFGVFLYMGISSMAGIQFLQRFKLLFKQAENYPELPYVRRVRTLKMHLYTLLQVLFLAGMWAVKESPVALALPFVIILLIPFRYFILPRIFTPQELKALDSKGVDDDEEKKEASVALEPFDALGGNIKTGNGHSLALSDDLDLGLTAESRNDFAQLSFRSI